MCVRRFACVNRRAHVRGTRVYMNLHNKKHGTYVDSAYTFFQFCPYPEDGLPIHCCSVSYSCDVSLRKLKLEKLLMHRIFRVPIFAGARKRKSSEILEFQSFALICYLLSRCVRKMNLISIPHVLNLLASS